MTPLTLQLETIVDYGPLVSLIGKDQATGRCVAVHLDYRPNLPAAERLALASCKEPAKFAAHGLAVGVEFSFTADLTDEPPSMPLVPPPRHPDR
jgi:hypothetical protein